MASEQTIATAGPQRDLLLMPIPRSATLPGDLLRANRRSRDHGSTRRLRNERRRMDDLRYCCAPWQRSPVVASFAGLGAEQQHRTAFEFDTDHPECFASEDNGATPVEFVLVGLAGCLTAGVAAVAQHRASSSARSPPRSMAR